MKPKRKERLNTTTKQKRSSVNRMQVKKNRKEVNNQIRSGYYHEDGDDEEWTGCTTGLRSTNTGE